MAIALVLLGIGLIVGGALTVTPATLGTSLIATGCFCGILARLAQADAHQNQVMTELKALRSASEKTETAKQQPTTSPMAEARTSPEPHVAVDPAADAVEVEVTQDEADERGIRCPNCNQLNQAERTVCWKCGARFKQT